ncbi:MAG TPA: hypothetical protein VG817_10910 [Gemmatimonadales bacterium]|nr:hypothetical protein [Gemmatimonadales bacterium]
MRGSLAALVALAIIPAVAVAQNYREVDDFPRRPTAYVGINLQGAFPQGEFADFVSTGFGVGANLTFLLDQKGQVGVRLFGSWIEYGRTTETVNFPGLPGIFVDLTTSNSIYSFGVGPEFQLSRGAVRPYLHGAIGLSNFVTSTSAEGTDNTEPFASSTNFNDWTVAYQGGGGLLFQVSHGKNPVLIDAGLRWQSHGRTRYLREGSLDQDGDGAITIDPVESKTDLLVVTVGVQIGI